MGLAESPSFICPSPQSCGGEKYRVLSEGRRQRVEECGGMWSEGGVKALVDNREDDRLWRLAARLLILALYYFVILASL